MEWPRGVNSIYSCGGDPLCTLHASSRRTVRLGSLYWGYMRVSRLKSKSGSSSHTGGSIQGRAALLYSMLTPGMDHHQPMIKDLTPVTGPRNYKLHCSNVKVSVPIFRCKIVCTPILSWEILHYYRLNVSSHHQSLCLYLIIITCTC